jgi:hypothetical protein
MTDKKLSQLPLGSAIGQSDLWYSDQSAASVAQKSSVVRTFVRPESIDVMNPTYGVVTGTVSGAQRLTNLAGINSAINDAIANNCGFVDFVGATYQIDGTIVVFDSSTPSGVTTRGPKLRGVRFSTRIEAWNSSGGIDTIHIGPPVGNASGQGIYGAGVEDLWIVSMIDQSSITPTTGNLGAQLSITGAQQCTFSGLAIGEVNQRIVDTTHFAYNALAMDPTSGAFECVFRDIEIKGFGNQGFIEYGTSGNYHYNIMIRNGGLGEPALKTSTGSAFQIFNSEGIVDELNIEWSIFGNVQPAMYAPSAAGIVWGHLHLEGLQQSQTFAGARAGLLLLGGAGMVRFESIHAISINYPTGCNIASAALFSFGFSGSYMYAVVGELLIAQTATLGTGVSWYLVNTYEGSGSGTVTNCQLDFDGPCVMFGDGSFASKLTNWSDFNGVANSQGSANGLGVPPSNFCGKSILTITTSAYGYSSGTFTASMVDGNDLYQWNAGVNGTVVLPLTVMDANLPITVPPYPGTEREVVNIDTHTCAVHDSAGTNLLTATNLTTGQFARFRFNGANWIQVNSGTRL